MHTDEQPPVGAHSRAPNDSVRSPQSSALSVAPEIEALRALLRRIGTDDPEERDDAIAEAKGVARVVSVLVAAMRLEHDLHPDDEAAAAPRLEQIISRALVEMEETIEPRRREEREGIEEK